MEGGIMKNVVQHLTPVVVVLVAITTAALAGAAWDFVDLNYEGAVWVQVFGTNERGLVTGDAGFPDGSSVGFIYDPKGQTFTELPPLPGCEPGAMGVNNAGVITGGCGGSPNLSDGFILKNGTYTRFAYPSFAFSVPRAISSTGLVTGYAGEASDTTDVGFIYDPARGTFTDIDIPGRGGRIIPQGVNARGRVVGNVVLEYGSAYQGSPEGEYGFVREPGGALTLFRVNDEPTAARGINDSGVIAGFTWLADGPVVGFVGRLPSLGGFQEMTDAELIKVPFDGATYTVPEAIDNSGRVVGVWYDRSGGNHGFIATPVHKGQKW
jgi:hypothetical protein